MGFLPPFEHWARSSWRFVPQALVQPRVVFLTCYGVKLSQTDQETWRALPRELFVLRNDPVHSELSSNRTGIWHPLAMPGPRFERKSVTSTPGPDASAHVRVAVTAGAVPKQLLEALEHQGSLLLRFAADDLGTMRRHLYSLKASGPDRHVLHALRITSPEHLPVKRTVALGWCKIIAKLATTRALVPITRRTPNNAIPSLRRQVPSGQTSYWTQRVHETILGCYGLMPEVTFAQSGDDPNDSSRGAGTVDSSKTTSRSTHSAFGLEGASPPDLVEGTLRALLALRTLKGVGSWFKLAGQQSGLGTLRRLPRSVALIGALAAAHEGFTEYQRIKTYGEALIDLAENHWRDRLGVS